MHHLELYSGIGGMRAGVAAVLPPHVQHKVHAVDVSTAANAAYAAAWGDKPRVLSLERACASDLTLPVPPTDGGPLLWTLSPPCQPYTRTPHARQRGDADPRASSFAHILSLLPHVSMLPSHMLLENVPSWAESSAAADWRGVLTGLGYEVHSVKLCPTQLGVPNRRRRFFSLARRTHRRRGGAAGGVDHGPLAQPFTQMAVTRLSSLDPSVELQEIAQQQQQQPLAAFLDHDDVSVQQSHYYATMPMSRLARYHSVLDIVTPECTSSNCFTAGYVRSVRTGSYLLPAAVAAAVAQRDARGRWHMPALPTPSAPHSSGEEALPPVHRPRAFTPREVASLLGFPRSFTLPPDDGTAYRLLGNSVSVSAVAFLAEVLLSDALMLLGGAAAAGAGRV